MIKHKIAFIVQQMALPALVDLFTKLLVCCVMIACCAYASIGMTANALEADSDLSSSLPASSVQQKSLSADAQNFSQDVSLQDLSDALLYHSDIQLKDNRSDSAFNSNGKTENVIAVSKQQNNAVKKRKKSKSKLQVREQESLSSSLTFAIQSYMWDDEKTDIQEQDDKLAETAIAHDANQNQALAERGLGNAFYVGPSLQQRSDLSLKEMLYNRANFGVDECLIDAPLVHLTRAFLYLLQPDARLVSAAFDFNENPFTFFLQARQDPNLPKFYYTESLAQALQLNNSNASVSIYVISMYEEILKEQMYLDLTSSHRKKLRDLDNTAYQESTLDQSLDPEPLGMVKLRAPFLAFSLKAKEVSSNDGQITIAPVVDHFHHTEKLNKGQNVDYMMTIKDLKPKRNCLNP